MRGNNAHAATGRGYLPAAEPLTLSSSFAPERAVLWRAHAALSFELVSPLFWSRPLHWALCSIFSVAWPWATLFLYALKASEFGGSLPSMSVLRSISSWSLPPLYVDTGG